ncbi:hypothetical protein VCHA37P200_50295 [Vibrio chagasii]|nr:hypothetical protein VCHA29O37_120041 [Vibrio chagasii]CAH6880102.1 hypothetical protein VCHA30O60_20193 [Vibrio chagasii]CAH6897719.1 hypothetical protein VCHA54P489_100153 [Vibrio chagasii]CAH7006484.1 hypothetical protein VCHA34P129_60041 [Vibrio chagasii]CAH7176405.1 hypothetical protein VCHA43P272_20309 [Vibrio chagasii]
MNHTRISKVNIHLLHKVWQQITISNLSVSLMIKKILILKRNYSLF